MKYKILLVEDDSSWQNIIKGKIRNALQRMNHEDYEIKIIDNFDQAYAVIEEVFWNLLVTDIGLGDSEQEEKQKLGKQLVEFASERNIPSIVVSGTTYLIRADVREILKKLGAYDFFAKETFDTKEFIDAVQTILEKQQQVGATNLSSNDDYKLTDDDSHASNKLSEEDRKYLIHKLAALARTAGGNPRLFFEQVINLLKLPENWKNKLAGIYTGDLNYDAEKLIDWCDIRFYPNGSKMAHNKVLGYLVKILFDESGDEKLREIILQYKLIPEDLI